MVNMRHIPYFISKKFNLNPIEKILIKVISRRYTLEKVTKSLQFSMNNYYTLNPSQIVMYTTEYCSDCMRAKRFFEANNIPYLRIGLEDNEDATEFVIQVNNGYRSVPTIIFPDGSILVEPSWEELKTKTGTN
jgi:mycoredoxin